MARKVMILGCGPAGMFAAHAAYRAGYDPIVLTDRKRPSRLFGAQYLHSAIPGLTFDAHFSIRYKLLGTTEGYRNKVYGPDFRGYVSPESHFDGGKCWSIREAYDRAWTSYRSAVHEVGRIHAGNVRDFIGAHRPELTFSTVPLVSFCNDARHRFREVGIYALGDAPELNHFVDDSFTVANFSVLCSGRRTDMWYRVSHIYGYRTVEWPLAARFMDGVDPRAEPVAKPISHDCTCALEQGIITLGRYGTWTKGVLSDSAYWTARRILETR